MFDTIIIGSGPAGVAAALYLNRAGMNVAVFTTNNSALLKADKIENYYGFRSISGKNLYSHGIKQLKNMSIPLYEEEVISINWDNPIQIETNETTYTAKTIVIATGINRESLKINNLKQLEGKGVSYCATCDGFFYKNKNIGLIGNGNLALHELNYLKQLSPNITVFTNGEPINPNIEKLDVKIIEDKIKSVVGTDKIESIELDNSTTIPIDGLFIAVGIAGATSFAKRLGLLENNNYLTVNDKFQTNIEGIYAIGDVISKNMQIAKAVSDGYLVSKEIIKYIKNKR